MSRRVDRARYVKEAIGFEREQDIFQPKGLVGLTGLRSLFSMMSRPSFI